MHKNNKPNRLQQQMFRLQQYAQPLMSKYHAETYFWQKTISDLEAWYDGELTELFGCKSPTEKQKVVAPTHKDSAILTWLDLHQKPKYLADLGLQPDAFKGKKLLDIGSGPLPSGLCFTDVELYCLDPLFDRYIAVGYPMHYYDNTKFIQAHSEAMPLEDSSIDAVISVNAIDHVDDLAATAKEIQRVLKADGKLAMHVHYHKATKTEPLEITDEMFQDLFGWLKGLKKVSVSTEKFGSTAEAGESYVLWRNF